MTAVFVAINFAIVCIALSALIGYRGCQVQEDFQIVQTGQYKGYAVIWTLSSELLIAQRLNRLSKVLGYDVALIKIDKDQPVNWHVVRVGTSR